MSGSWQELIKDKQARHQAAIPKQWLLPKPPATDLSDVSTIPEACGVLSEKDIEITSAEITTILNNLAVGAWSSVAVTTAFSKRAIIAHQLTNCLTEIFIDRALVRAAELDDHLQKTGKVVGPLHGLPVSLKDQICVKGVEATMGYATWIGKYSERNAVLVDILESLGAVPFVKTNVPQTLMWPETFNHVFGRTVNPYNRSLTSGGSSGGEGALIALKGSPLGVGSDIGGSVRIPSAFCGLYGLRPSYGRVPYAGAVNSLEGQDSLLSVLGPMSNSLEGIKVFMQGVVGGKPWLKDPLAARKPWSEEEYTLVDHNGGKDLCFGIIWDDGIVRPHPPVLRALEKTKQALIAAGHKVIDWEPRHHLETFLNMCEIFRAGAAEDFKATTLASGEPQITTMSLNPDSKPFVLTPQLQVHSISAFQLWQIHKRKRDLREAYLEYWLSSAASTGTGRPVDAIICPAAPSAAPPHGEYKDIHYTMVWNALDYTACVIPVTKVDPVVDVQRAPHQFHSDNDEAHYNSYTPSRYENAPVAVQIVGRRLDEEAVIGLSEVVDKALKNHREQV